MPKVKVTVEGQMFILFRNITSTIMNGFQNNLAHLFSLRSTSVMRKTSFDAPKVKVTVEGQMSKLTLSRALLLHL